MKIEILFFGAAHEMTGSRSMQVEIPDDFDTSALKAMLEDRYSGLNSNLRYALAVNQKVTTSNVRLSDGDVVAVLPPVSGG